MSKYNQVPEFTEWYENGGMSGVPLLPGEEDWASWKCGGGPYQQTDSTPPRNTHTTYIQEVPYSGTESTTTYVKKNTNDPLNYGV